MHTLKVVVCLPDVDHPTMEVRLSADDAPNGVVIALASRKPPVDPESSDDDYVLGGYAGI